MLYGLKNRVTRLRAGCGCAVIYPVFPLVCLGCNRADIHLRTYAMLTHNSRQGDIHGQ